MTKYKCRCGYKGEIFWGIKGYGLLEAHIYFECPKCGTPASILIVFPKDKRKKPKVKVDTDKLSYVG